MNDIPRILPHRLRVPAKWRELIEDEIERLCRILDRLDGDPDLEDDGTSEPDADGEPSLGCTSREATSGRHNTWHTPCGEPEASLGSVERIDQTHWWAGRNDDAESEHAGREPNTDSEDQTTEFHGGSVIAGMQTPALGFLKRATKEDQVHVEDHE